MQLISKILFTYLLLLLFTSQIFCSNEENEPIVNNNGCNCTWSPWMNNQDYHPLEGDNNSYEALRQNNDFCTKPHDIECRERRNPGIPFSIAGQPGVDCDVTNGLTCVSSLPDYSLDEPEKPFFCHDYIIRVLCCLCPTTTTTTTTVSATTTTTQHTETTIPFHVMNDPVVHNSTAPHTTILQRNKFFVYIIIIVVIVAGVITILGLILYFARSKKYPKPAHASDYMAADMYDFQRRPVSFTEVDRHASLDNSTTSLTTPSSGSYRSAQFTHSKLEFSPTTDGHDEPDVIVSTRHNDVIDEHRWFPDEHEIPTRQMGKKLLFGRAFTPVQRNLPYMDDEQI